MVAVTPGGGIQDNGRTPTMTIKPAAWAAALFAYAGINIIAAVDSVLPSGSGQVWAAGFVTAIAAGAGGDGGRNVVFGVPDQRPGLVGDVAGAGEGAVEDRYK